ncbi:MAG: hypothetical protein F6K30_23020 [Cyanothece sp. SIO2G6]|nr:hypothetical protein [Cyanothece sp. SIO2G6]
MPIVKTLLLLYLRRYPNRFRLSQLNFLSQYSWLQNVLAEIRTELFPDAKKQDETSLEAVEPTAPDAEVLQILAADIRGRRGTYHVDQWLYQRGHGYLFQGSQTGMDRPVVVKEYLLNQQFYNPQELRDRQDTFEKLAGITLADGRIQDLRVLCPLEAIADTHASHRCYLITAAQDAAPNLRQCLQTRSLPTAPTVRHILLHVLQTLELLHQQKFRLPSGKTRVGLYHGNLSLDSVLWVDPSENSPSNSPDPKPNHNNPDNWSQHAYVYLTDLALWEDLFAPPTVSSPSTTSANAPFQDDLKALGQIGFDLLMGQPDSTADPLDDAVWHTTPPLLKDVVERLLAISPPFASAAAARLALLRFPEDDWVPNAPPDSDADTAEQRSPRWWLFLLILGGLGLLVGMIWAIWGRSPLMARSQSPRTCCLDEIEAVPSGRFLYTFIESGSWEYVWRQTGIGKRDWTLKDHFRQAYPNMDLVGQTSVSVEEAIAKVQTQAVDFAIIPQLGPLPADLGSEAIAYDGLAVFVAFNYARRNQGLPSALNGQLSLEELRKLYWGNVTNWLALGASPLRVQLYAPTNREAREIFEQLVLNGQSLDDPLDGFDSTTIKTADTFEMLRSIIRDFEQPGTSSPAGSIGFSHLSRIFGQCSVYPLAIDQDDDGQSAIQPLVLQDGASIQPQTDLCDRKGTYEPDTRLFQTEVYPLAYPLIVIYPRDNSLPPIGSKFVEAITTIEGQWLLEEGGVVPLEPIDDSVGQPRLDTP